VASGDVEVCLSLLTACSRPFLLLFPTLLAMPIKQQAVKVRGGGVDLWFYFFFNLGVGGQRHAPAALPLAKKPGSHYTGC
jgi:hypothetical protein